MASVRDNTTAKIALPNTAKTTSAARIVQHQTVMIANTGACYNEQILLQG